MAEIESSSQLPSDFSGVVPLFPLPNLVLFPGVLQPLHVFEPRYRAMLEHTLAADGLIAISLLKPGWESDYEGRPPVSPVVCVGRVLNHSVTEAQKYNILLLGIKRAGIVRELPPLQPYRTVQVELLEDNYPTSGASTRQSLRRELIGGLREFVRMGSPAQKQFDQLIANDVSLGLLTDLVAYTMSLDLSIKQDLLSECNVDRRARVLLAQLSRASSLDPPSPGGAKSAEDQASFPPRFSDN